jgi:4-carboxymuconolactone decarboxylase
MPRIEPLQPQLMDGAQRRLYDDIAGGPRSNSHLTDAGGALRGPFDLMLRAPAIGDALQALGSVLRFGGSLPDDLRELAILCAASEWRCEFELKVHGRMARAAGLPADILKALRDGGPVQLETGSSAALVHTATTELFTAHRLADDTYAALVERLGVSQTVELLILLGYYSTLAMMLEVFEIGL